MSLHLKCGFQFSHLILKEKNERFGLVTKHMLRKTRTFLIETIKGVGDVWFKKQKI